MAEYSDATLRYTKRNSLAIYIYDKDKVKRIMDNLLPQTYRLKYSNSHTHKTLQR